MGVEIPPRMRHLPLDKHRRPVPWFAHRDASGPDHRVVRAGGIAEAIRYRWCWVCGTPIGRFGAFVIGPMCAVNRVSSEPPSHRECGLYSAQACPFLTTPNMTRREGHLPENYVNPAGIMFKRNPGVTLVWISRDWKAFKAPGGLLFDIGTADSVSWFAEGRPATREEILTSIQSGLPALQELAVEDGEDAVAELEHRMDEAMALVPA